MRVRPLFRVPGRRVKAVRQRDPGDRKGPVRHINELQYIDGIIFANVWQTNIILAIDASTGEVIRKYYIHLKSKGIRFPNLNGRVEINWVGTTIGSHTGPGTVSLFFWGDKRER